MQPIISIRNLGKRYRLGGSRGHDTLRDQLAHGTRGIIDRLTGRSASASSDVKEDCFWALKDVSFDVHQGEVIGVIGRNGAGKSTLLKVLSQITEPTSGEIRVRGRLASLLEVGTGFHPELSGRENIYLNGAILGMTRSEIRKKFDEIVAFAEVEKFLDLPVKRYSSGMYVRLAFAVAAHLEPEILVVDEVLAVGDAAFQKKCLGKMKEVGVSGRTVLFVSHNMGLVSNLCTRGVVLQSGTVGFDGPTEAAVNHYSRLVTARGDDLDAANVIYTAPELKPDKFAITKIELLETSGKPKHCLMTWDDAIFRFHYHSPRPVQRGSVALQLATFDGARLVTLSTQPDSTVPLELNPGAGAVDLIVRKFPLAAGEYLVGAGLAVPQVEYLCWSPDLCWLSVLPKDTYGSGLAPSAPRSAIAIEHEWRTVSL